MTHTLHRRGTVESLAKDFIIFAIAAQTVNSKGSIPKFKEFANIVLKYKPVNFGDMRTGNQFNVGIEKIQANFQENSIVHAVFTEKEIVVKVLKELKDKDLGLSIVVSGLLDQTAECCRKAGIKPHTEEHSLGIFGRTDFLPQEEILQINTMCGHGMVAFSLIKNLIEQIKEGKTTPEKAAIEMAQRCHCGVFNPERAVQILKGILR